MTPDHELPGKTGMPPETDTLTTRLRGLQPDVPAGFEQRVMAAIQREPAPGRTGPAGNQRRDAGSHWQRWLTCGALGAAGIAGLAQFITFLFAIWAASAAG